VSASFYLHPDLQDIFKKDSMLRMFKP